MCYTLEDPLDCRSKQVHVLGQVQRLEYQHVLNKVRVQLEGGGEEEERGKGEGKEGGEGKGGERWEEKREDSNLLLSYTLSLTWEKVIR